MPPSKMLSNNNFLWKLTPLFRSEIQRVHRRAFESSFTIYLRLLGPLRYTEAIETANQRSLSTLPFN